MATIRERHTKKKGTHYYVEVRLRGHPPMFATFARKTEAKKWAQQKEAGIRSGKHFGTSESRNKTLADMVDRYLRDVLPQRGSDKRDVERQLKFWKNELGSYRLSDIKPAMIAELRDRLLSEETNRGQRRTPGTVVRYLAALSLCYGWAVKEWAWAEENPVKKVRKPKESRGRLRFLSDDERKELLKACKARLDECPCLHTVVLLALSTGARQGEILGLHWKHVDLKRRRIILEDTKNGESRSVPISGPALDALAEMRKVRRIDTTLVFPNDEGTKPVSIRRAWDKAVEDAKLTNFRFHDLRHTAASYLAMGGASLVEISEILGHKSLSMVKRYAHLAENHTADVLERMNRKMFAES